MADDRSQETREKEALERLQRQVTDLTGANFATKAASFAAAADLQEQIRRDADEITSLKRQLDVEKKEKIAMAEVGSTVAAADKSRVDAEEQNKALRTEVERLLRAIASAEANYETLNAQARKSRLVHRHIKSHHIPYAYVCAY